MGCATAALRYGRDGARRVHPAVARGLGLLEVGTAMQEQNVAAQLTWSLLTARGFTPAEPSVRDDKASRAVSHS
eukprot:3907980-Amphidinium_carterae.1